MLYMYALFIMELIKSEKYNNVWKIKLKAISDTVRSNFFKWTYFMRE